MIELNYSNDRNDNNQSVIIAGYVQGRVNGSLFHITLYFYHVFVISDTKLTC